MKIFGEDFSAGAVIALLGAVIVLVVLLAMGVTVASQQVFGVPPDPPLNLFSWGVSFVGVGVSITLVGTFGYTGGKIATAASAHLTKTQMPYLPYVGSVVTTFTSVTGSWFADQPYVGFLVGLVFGLVTTFAASLITTRPGWALAIYGLVLAAIAGLIMAVETPQGMLDWARGLSPREWSLVLTVVVVSAGVPLFVAWVEHHDTRAQLRKEKRDRRRKAKRA
jgi:hypothetical protein